MKKLNVFLLALVTLLLSSTAQAQVSQGQARNYQINETHTGYAEAPGLTPPLKQRWAVNFGKSISYPLIADGRVFVTVGIAAGSGTKLYALDAASGFRRGFGRGQYLLQSRRRNYPNLQRSVQRFQ